VLGHTTRTVAIAAVTSVAVIMTFTIGVLVYQHHQRVQQAKSDFAAFCNSPLSPGDIKNNVGCPTTSYVSPYANYTVATTPVTSPPPTTSPQMPSVEPTTVGDVQQALEAGDISVLDSKSSDPPIMPNAIYETWFYLTSTYGQVVTVDTFTSHADLTQAVALDRTNTSGDPFAPYVADIAFDTTMVLVRISAALPESLRTRVMSVVQQLPNARIAFTS